MSSGVLTSALYADLFPEGGAARLWSASAEVRAMLIVEGALAEAQGALGVIPEISAQAIKRAAMEVSIDPGALARATGQNGVPVPALVAAFRTEMHAPEHAQYIHWGATSQDIMDTGLMLRLRQTLAVMETGLREVLAGLADKAEANAATPMVARTYGQHATLTSYGAVLAQWGGPLVDLLNHLAALREEALRVSLSGAAGTARALPRAVEPRAKLAEALGLRDPACSWHTDRGPVMRIVDWMAAVSAALGAMGQGLTALAASDVIFRHFLFALCRLWKLLQSRGHRQQQE